MSPEDFHKQAREHKNDIRKAWDVVSEGREIFERDAIWPDQCDRVRRSISVLNEPVQEFSCFLDSDSIAIIPLEFIPARYTLLRALHRIDQSVDDLTTLLITFRNICCSPSREATLQKNKIQRKLLDIEKDKDNIQYTLDELTFPQGARVS